MNKYLQIIVSFILVLALIAVPALAMTFLYVETHAIGATNTTVLFTNDHSGGAAQRFYAKEITIYNDGTTTIHADPLDGIATVADDYPIEAGANAKFSYLGTGDGFASIGIISASGTNNVRVVAVR